VFYSIVVTFGVGHYTFMTVNGPICTKVHDNGLNKDCRAKEL
jgi:hypothetical protein